MTVKNNGGRSGKEVVQLYVREMAPQAVQSLKELKAFAKVWLEPGQEKLVTFDLDSRAFAHYDMASSAWRVASGKYEILVGASSQDISCHCQLDVAGLSAYAPLTINSMIKHFEQHPRGRRFYLHLVQATNQGLVKDPDQESTEDWSKRKLTNVMLWAFVDNLPVSKLPAFSQGRFTEAMLKKRSSIRCKCNKAMTQGKQLALTVVYVVGCQAQQVESRRLMKRRRSANSGLPLLCLKSARASLF